MDEARGVVMELAEETGLNYVSLLTYPNIIYTWSLPSVP